MDLQFQQQTFINNLYFNQRLEEKMRVLKVLAATILLVPALAGCSVLGRAIGNVVAPAPAGVEYRGYSGRDSEFPEDMAQVLSNSVRSIPGSGPIASRIMDHAIQDARQHGRSQTGACRSSYTGTCE